MAQQTFDPSSKWMLSEQGASILYLAGVRSVLSCKARQAEVVQPRKLPDGLLEVRFAGRAEPSLVLVEVATYPEPRVVQQMQDGIGLVRQAHGVLPEALVLCLCARGNYRVPAQAEERSTLGWTGAALSWKVVEVWTLPAEELLAAPNVGVALWGLLAHWEGPPEILLRQCRERIDREGGAQTANLLAVAQVFARLHFNQPEWLHILGGSKAMIESPLIQEIVAESARATRVKDVVEVLEARFGAVSHAIRAGVEQVKGEESLLRLTRQAAVCADLQAFEDQLRRELPAPAQTSTRGKRRTRKPSS
jgi:hypothetical protein